MIDIDIVSFNHHCPTFTISNVILCAHWVAHERLTPLM